MKNWFKKAPYIGWIVSICTFLLTSFYFYFTEKKQSSPEALATLIQGDFRFRYQQLELDIKDGLLHNLKLSEKQPLNYFLFEIDDGISSYWNSIDVIFNTEIRENVANYRQGKLVKLSKGYFYIKSWPSLSADSLSTKNVLAAIPISFEYPVENEYFQSHFVADKRIPLSTIVASEPSDKSFVVYTDREIPAFYITFTQTESEYFTISPLVWIFSLLTLFCVIVWIHEFSFGIGLRFKNEFWGWLTLAIILLVLRLIYQISSIPIGFLNTEIFSPELYSSNVGIDSFVTFIFNSLIITWLLFYFSVYVPKNKALIFKNRSADILAKIGIVFTLFFFLYYYLALQLININADSKISFDFNNLYNLNAYNLLGIFCILFLTIDFILIVVYIYYLLFSLPYKRLVKVILAIVNCAIIHISAQYFIEYYHENIQFLYLIVLGIGTSFLLIQIFGLPFRNGMLRASTNIKGYLWVIAICSCVAAEIFYFNILKEQELRKAFATRLLQSDDALIDYKLNELGAKMAVDSFVQTAFKGASEGKAIIIEQYLYYKYFEEFRNRFDIKIDLRKKSGLPIVDKDGMSNLVDDAINNSERKGYKVPIGFFSVEQYKIKNLLYYFTVPVIASQADTIGLLTIGLGLDKRPKISFQHSLIEKKYNETDFQHIKNYSYAIYRKNNLWSQGGDELFPFNTEIPNFEKGEEFLFDTYNPYYSRLSYRPSETEFIKVGYKQNLLLNLMSLFSLVLFEVLVFILFTVAIRFLLFYPYNLKSLLKIHRLTIRSKINFTILITVLAALVLVGIITVSFLINRYKQSQERNLQSTLLYYSQNIQHFALEKNIALSGLDIDYFSPFSDLSFRLHALAKEQGADINIYNTKGKLIATSQLELFNKGLMSANMQRSALKQLGSGSLPKLVLDDRIGNLTYQNIFTTLRNDENEVIAYLNLPYYASKADVKDEISNIVLLIINVYSFVFFVAVFGALMISNNIVDSFKLLIQQFRNIRLKHNEYLEWPNNDEIGLLVREYNLMIQKVETMASKLTQTEREATWREIAKQIAHEIKNPLTPMKLNIQYLQQAIASGRSDIEELASRVSKTLIEQIENLNYIASEFSNFAKLPESNPLKLDIIPLLKSLVDLYQKNNDVKIEFNVSHPSLFIVIDKSHALRVFTNLILNAIQATEEQVERKVSVNVTLEESNVLIAVEDNGHGIPEELKERLFLPYFTTKSSGTGLGLSMTKNMVENAHGTIWFETEAQMGTVFYLKFPQGE